MPIPRLPRLARAIVLALAVLGAAYAETAAEMEAKTDRSDPEQLFALAQWYDENGMKTKALRAYNDVVKLERDHEGAREALGQIKVGNNWVKASHAAGRPGKGGKGGEDPAAAGAAGGGRVAKGKGPSAAEVAWDLTVPREPKENQFIQKYIDRLPTVGNDSTDMGNAVATMMMDDHLASAIPRLCQALKDGFGDLYGACDLIIGLEQQGRLSLAKPMLPFLVKGSEKVTDVEDLSSFCYVVAMFRDKRALPRLLELMDNPNDEVSAAATDAVATLTLMPAQNLTAAKARDWWDLNHDVPDQRIFSEQLNSRDPAVAVQAAKALYESRDKAIVPVLIRLLKSDDPNVGSQAIEVLRRITGNEWGYDPRGDREHKAKVSERVEKWWSEEQFRWIWIDDRKAQADVANAAPAEQADPNREFVAKLGSTEGNEAQLAEASLRSAGDKAVPALIAGLDDASRLVRRKCEALLRTITKQDIAFDPAGSDEDRAKGVAEWRAWATKQGLLAAEEPAGEEEGAAPAPADDDGEDAPAQRRQPARGGIPGAL